MATIQESTCGSRARTSRSTTRWSRRFAPKYAELVRRFRAAGRGDFVAEIVQQPGVNLCENEFRIDVRDGTVNHSEFPLPLEKMKGRLVVRTTATDPTRPVHPGEPLAPPPDRDEIVLDGFTAIHAGAAVWLNGSKRPIPDSRDHKMTLPVGGEQLPGRRGHESRARRARGRPDLDRRSLREDKVTFAADIEIIDRAPPADRPGFRAAAQPRHRPEADVQFLWPDRHAVILPIRDDRPHRGGWSTRTAGSICGSQIAARHGDTRVKMARR